MVKLCDPERVILEQKIARWVWNEHRPVTAAEIAVKFSIGIHSARCLIQRIMRRTDGIRCSLETSPGINSAGHSGMVKYFSVIHLPDSYMPKGKR